MATPPLPTGPGAVGTCCSLPVRGEPLTITKGPADSVQGGPASSRASREAHQAFHRAESGPRSQRALSVMTHPTEPWPGPRRPARVWLSARGHKRAGDGPGVGPRRGRRPPHQNIGSTSMSRAQRRILETRPRGDRRAPQGRGGSLPCALHPGPGSLQAAPRGPPGVDSPSGVVSLSQSQASTMRVKERCGRGEGGSSFPAHPSPAWPPPPSWLRPRDAPPGAGTLPLPPGHRGSGAWTPGSCSPPASQTRSGWRSVCRGDTASRMGQRAEGGHS